MHYSYAVGLVVLEDTRLFYTLTHRVCFRVVITGV